MRLDIQEIKEKRDPENLYKLNLITDPNGQISEQFTGFLFPETLVCNHYKQ
jgi:hypothetical protein